MRGVSMTAANVVSVERLMGPLVAALAGFLVLTAKFPDRF